MASSSKIKRILVSGICAGILDISGALIVYAFILKVTTPQRLLQSVASGALGKASFQGGNQTAAAGLLFHFCIAMIFAIFYSIIHPALNRIISNTFLKGFLYGCFAWCVMNLLVLPLVNIPIPTFRLNYFLYGIGLIIFCIGIPIAYITDYYLRRKLN